MSSESQEELMEENIQQELDENAVIDESLQEESATNQNAKHTANQTGSESAKNSAAHSANSTENDSENAKDESSKEDLDAEANKKIQDMSDKYLRLHAEFDNYRRRTAREILEITQTANAKLMSKLIDVADNFERAFSEEHKTDDLEGFRKGMLLIQEQFISILKDSGLESIDPTGEEFDPNSHEAMMQQPSDDIEEGHVITTYQKGYQVKDKVIRAAKVIVSSGTPQ